MTDLYYPLRSLREGYWFKLICGASFQHLPAIRNLVLAYTLAGADCIDVAADPAVIATAKAALEVAADFTEEAREHGYAGSSSPWLMVSFNDNEDPHFRKAEFDAASCPIECPRPCVSICPAQAIVFQTDKQGVSGVLSDRCYGCGRCLPICPIQHIATRSYVSTPEAIAPLVLEAGVDAIEIHTQIGRIEDFRRLWKSIEPWVCRLKLVAISCPDGDGLSNYLWSLYETISPLPCALVWQTDGRPMSGDIGAGTTRAAVKLGQKVLAAGLPGYVQLAGGTNHHTVEKLTALGLLASQSSQAAPVTALQDNEAPAIVGGSSHIAGIAYGSYARSLLLPVLNQLEAIVLEAVGSAPSPVSAIPTLQTTCKIAQLAQPPVTQTTSPMHSEPVRLENVPDLLWQAVDLAHSLVSQLKPSTTMKQSMSQHWQ